uniref:Uncharacterized protein n=1 Tax=Nonomuraea gerenzanensis TaxID=93944 RepID=A0A1M4E1L0_9ACTN|nr:hypothetical protein BN4615_P2192 [Nonomuraea gerenzanensis]
MPPGGARHLDQPAGALSRRTDLAVGLLIVWMSHGVPSRLAETGSGRHRPTDGLRGWTPRFRRHPPRRRVFP